jgi:hypothetical protein
LFHAVNAAGLRQSAALPRAADVARLSQVALLKRLRKSRDWLAWIGAGLCGELRDRAGPPGAVRLRVVDSTTVRGPASRGTHWGVHYALNLTSLRWDWRELSDAHGGESLTRVPLRQGDVILADRDFFTPRGCSTPRATLRGR